MLRLDVGYYILDARCVMLNAKVHRAVPDSGFRERRLLAYRRRLSRRVS